jgi:multidrug resistance efflux pump
LQPGLQEIRRFGEEVNARIGLAIVASIVPVLIGCGDDREAAATDTPQLEVKATIDKPQTAVITAPSDGRIATVHAREGAAVKAGDVVVTLVNPAVERDLAYARAQLALAEHRLRAAMTPKAAAVVDSEATEALVRSRKGRLDRYRQLYATHDIAAQDLENAEAEYIAATRELAAERAASVSPASTTDPSLLRLEVERAKAEVAVVSDREKQLVVKAPIAGVVVRQTVSEGDAVYPRDPLLEIANSTTLDVRGSVAPELMRYVRAGMPVGVKVFTVPPRRFTANIRSVVPPTDASGATIVVPVPNPDGVLQPGTAATITVR